MLGFAALGRTALGQAPPVQNPIVLGATGTFTLTGNAVTFDRTAPAAVGAFTLTGQPTLRLFSMPHAVGAFTLSGQAANLEHGYRLVASASILDTQEQPMFQALGVLAIGQSGTATAQATTFLFTGINAFFEREVSFQANVGTFTLTGNAAALTFQGYPDKIRAFPRVAFGMRAGTRGGDAIVAKPRVGTNPRARAFGG